MPIDVAVGVGVGVDVVGPEAPRVLLALLEREALADAAVLFGRHALLLEREGRRAVVVDVVADRAGIAAAGRVGPGGEAVLEAGVGVEVRGSGRGAGGGRDGLDGRVARHGGEGRRQGLDGGDDAGGRRAAGGDLRAGCRDAGGGPAGHEGRGLDGAGSAGIDVALGDGGGDGGRDGRREDGGRALDDAGRVYGGHRGGGRGPDGSGGGRSVRDVRSAELGAAAGQAVQVGGADGLAVVPRVEVAQAVSVACTNAIIIRNLVDRILSIECGGVPVGLSACIFRCF